MEPVVSLVQVGGNLLLKLLHQTRGGYIALTILVIIWSAFVTRELAEYLPYTLLDSVIESNCITYHYVVFQNIEVGVHPLGIGPAPVFCPYSQFRLRAKRGLRLPAGAQRTADAIYLCSNSPLSVFIQHRTISSLSDRCRALSTPTQGRVRHPQGLRVHNRYFMGNRVQHMVASSGMRLHEFANKAVCLAKTYRKEQGYSPGYPTRMTDARLH